MLKYALHGSFIFILFAASLKDNLKPLRVFLCAGIKNFWNHLIKYEN